MKNDSHIRIRCSAAYSDGTTLFDNELMAVDTILRPISVEAGARRFQMVDLRVAVPKDKAEEFLEGLRTGTAELYIEGMESRLAVAA